MSFKELELVIRPAFLKLYLIDDLPQLDAADLQQLRQLALRHELALPRGMGHQAHPVRYEVIGIILRRVRTVGRLPNYLSGMFVRDAAVVREPVPRTPFYKPWFFQAQDARLPGNVVLVGQKNDQAPRRLARDLLQLPETLSEKLCAGATKARPKALA